jgi:hypothetical protein
MDLSADFAAAKNPQPVVEERLCERILGRRGELEAARRPRLAVFRWFLVELRVRGFERRGE